MEKKLNYTYPRKDALLTYESSTRINCLWITISTIIKPLQGVIIYIVLMVKKIVLSYTYPRRGYFIVTEHELTNNRILVEDILL